MLKGLAVLVLYLFAGEALSQALQWRIPGPVTGMLLLFLSLQLLPAKPLADTAEVASKPLIQWLPLFFLPAGAGIFFLPAEVIAQWPAILAAMLVGTAASLWLCSLLLKRLANADEQ
ncbi:CidA/LrgA family protein [Simiduia agarivorans]|uniref:LrgA n=1 Tax=Simiduia agarivorans (strain DSM 21679 / JCM 13881 / BCRC 17597 / SA1) TaxID=1117647 RepID=K4KKT0_SIMAS|nr:CidA/LrgA family protein [Simiduia agarivorans]AFU99744.1 LrgA [Simiduia agarivorans SA1 = DSM 21679]